MPIVFGCIAPHSGNLLRGKHESSPIPRTRAAMQEIHRRLQSARPDTIALITPHGVVVDGAYSVAVTPRCAGVQDGMRVEAETDRDLAGAWAYQAAARDIPVVPLTMRDDHAPFPLDWGAAIPLALAAPSPGTPPIVVACPSPALTRPQLIGWGDALVDAADQSGKRVAFIVSADQGHGHAVDGPYGYSPQSAEYDRAMCDAIRAGDLTRLLDWDDAWIAAAQTDSYWQTLAMLGVQRRIALRAEFLSYEIDHYFGLLCAAFTPPVDPGD